MYVFSMLSLGRILILDLVIADLFIHSLPGMILLYVAMHAYLDRRHFCMRYHHFHKVNNTIMLQDPHSQGFKRVSVL